MRIPRAAVTALFLASLAGLAACGSVRTGKHDRECMARAMYFESNRSSDEGMLAVGTVVMNRVRSDKFPDTVCGVVGQKNQFAPGVLSKPMKEGKSRERAYRMADKVLSGKRHRGVGEKAMFFHTAGYSFRYDNMHYQVIAGGNAFYEKRTAKAGQRNRTQREAARRSRPERPDREEREPRRRESEPERRREVAVAAAEPPRPVAAPAPAPQPAPQWAPATAEPILVWTPAPPTAPPPVWTPEPALAIAPAPPPGSIEELIALSGG